MTTLYQTVDGTEVTTSGEPVGLVLDKSRFGEELVTNGTFDTDVNGWIIQGTGATFESVNGHGVLTYGGANAYANYYISSVIGEIYNLQFDVISGGGGLSTGGDWDNIVIDSAGHYSLYMTATSTTSLVRFYTLSGSLTIDNVSVRQVDSVVLGSELVTNGTFDTDTAWTKGAGWSISGGVATADTTLSSDRLTSSLPWDGANNKTYYVTATFTMLATPNANARVRINAGGLGENLIVDSEKSLQVGQTYTLSGFINPTSVSGDFYFRIGSSANYAMNYTIDNISVKEVLGTHAKQPTATSRPTFQASPNRLELDLVDDGLLVDIPTGGWNGYMVVGTDLGTASYGVSLPEGQYELGGDYFFGNSINQVLFKEGNVEQAHLKFVEQMFVEDGAKASYGDVTDFGNYWRDKGITEFPMIDTSSGTNFYFAWGGNNLTSFPLLDTSSGTNFYAAWYKNNLTSFPLLDTSSGTNFSFAWRENDLTSFPLLDVSNGTNFYAAWRGNSLTSFPLIDTSSGTNFSYAWYGNSLTEFPLLDVSSGTNFASSWAYNGLTSFPQLDMSNATSVNSAWRNNNLAEFPAIDFPVCTNFSNTWRDNNLTSFPLIDTSSGIDFSVAWIGNNLTEFPQLDMSNAIRVDSAWQSNNLTSFPAIDMPNCVNFYYAWFNNNLTSFPQLDMSSATNVSGTWRDNNNLSDFPANMFDNCPCTSFASAFLGTNLTQTSIDNILVSIDSNGTSNGTFDQSGGSAPSSVGEAAIDNLRSRGWTITVTGGY